MIKVTIGSNFNRKQVIIPETTTIKAALEQNDVDYMSGGINLDGCTLLAGDINRTFADMGVSSGDTCMLMQVVKSQNA